MTDRDRRLANVVIAILIVVGVAVRLFVVRAQGFPSDVGTFMAWAERLAAIGPGRFYEPGYFTDYPPGFLYVLWLLGAVFDGELLRLAVKAISTPADIGIVLLIVPLIRRHAGNAAAVLAAGLWMLQPAPIFAGPYWGQVDAVGTVPLLAALVAAGTRRWALAGVLAGLATMTKPQFGLVVGVIAVAAAIELIRARDWRPIVSVAGASLVTLLALALPFGMSPAGFVGLVRSAFETYPYSSLYAFNGWAAALTFWRLARGEARFTPTIALGNGIAATLRPLPPRWTAPVGLRIGGPALRRDIVLALIIAVAVLGTRGFRLDWPRDMYFDEVYHARTAFELLAQRDPYEWTHPHLAKEVMALGILAFGDDRVVGTESAPANVTAFTVANDGTRAYAH